MSNDYHESYRLRKDSKPPPIESKKPSKPMTFSEYLHKNPTGGWEGYKIHLKQNCALSSNLGA